MHVPLRGCIAMSRFLVLYTFHRIDAMSLHRLMRLARMNPDVTIVPVFGIGLKKSYLNLFYSKSLGYRKLMNIISGKIGRMRRKAEIDALEDYLEKRGFLLHCDPTPDGKYNQDLAIVNWFSTQGKKYNFNFLIYFEYDMFCTKTIENLYETYTSFDAGFACYGEATPLNFHYNHPPKARLSIVQWLKRHGSTPIPQNSFFPGNIISRKALARLAKIDFPIGYCELRLPSVLKGLGYSCTKLNFPMFRYCTSKSEGLSKTEIEKETDYGIFHPVYDDFEV
jgi:hypothetical protein